MTTPAVKFKKSKPFGIGLCLLGSVSLSLAGPMGNGGGGSHGGGSAYGGGGGSQIPDIATNYVIRMQEMVKQADDAALRGSQLMADGDYEGAVEQYKNAIDLLPDAPMTEQRRRAYIKQYARAATTLARQYAEGGRYNEAMALIEDVLRPTVAPDNLAAKRLLEQLYDPEYFSPALSPEHLERVRNVKRALTTGRGYMEYGDYDRAEREYHRALNIDRYNSAARRSIEEVERLRMNYYDVARDQTRSTLIREVMEGWELPVPNNVDIPETSIGTNTTTQAIIDNENKLKNIIIPSIEFSDTPLKDALDFLYQKSVELDFKESDANKKGVNIILSAGGAAPAPAAPAGGGGDGGGFGFEGGGGAAGGGFGGGLGAGVENTPITLRLTNVPLGEALRYTTSLADLKYKVESHAVLVVPLSTPDNELFTNKYTVPPTFLNSGGGGAGADPAVADPFAPAPAGGGNTIQTKKTARQILEEAGITFPPGATAIYNPGTSTLIVKNTPDQMDLVEAYIESIITGVEKQIFITSKFIEIGDSLNKELGFDWTLGAFNFGNGVAPSVFGGGGTVGNSVGVNLNGQNFTFLNPGGSVVGVNPVTSALRSGSRGVSGNSIDALIAAPNTGAVSGAAGSAAPAVFGIAGVFTDPQFQMMIRALNQKTGVDIMSAPSVMARSGNRAKIEVIREFIYPTEYDPPEIPTNFGGGGGGGGVTVITSFPVTPATPTAFDVRNTGVTLEVDPVLGADNYTIDLNLAPEVVEFDGFINYGSPINTINPVTGTAVQLTANRIEMPVFNTRKVTTQVTIWDGQTIALGGLIREDIQDIEDKIPFIGDLPAIGRLFRNNVELHIKKNLTIFVRAEIQDPSGQPIHSRIDDDEPNYIEPRPPRVAPAPVGPNFGPIPYQK